VKKTILVFVFSLVGFTGSAQIASDHEEFEYNRHIIQGSKSFVPKNGFVSDKDTAIAIAYAVAVPVYGKKEIDSEKPLRAELNNGVWTVLGTLNCESCAGGTLVMQIEKVSGKIIFLTHTK